MDDGAMDRLERMVLDASAEPIELPLPLLLAITKNFSDDHIIGTGGFAKVYKGILQNGTVVAVKKLSDTPAMDDEKFSREVGCLMKARHKNIVRFLGYYADTQLKLADYEGKMVMAGVRQWLLCFEFLPKGSLDWYINDAAQGFEWSHCYKIIKGICEGLHYLHRNSIVHLDLKPANILLNCNMVPKIADFGISRCFDAKQSQAMTSNVVGTLGYMAPEFIYNGQITFKSDIYSLGTIILEILTRKKANCEVENVLESWSNKFETSQITCTQLEHVRVCAEISIACRDDNPAKRPAIECIIEALGKVESTDDSCFYITSSQLQRVITGSASWSCYYETDSLGSTEISKLMDVQPLELCFPFKPNRLIHCPLNLTNKTDRYVGVRITQTSHDSLYLPFFEMMEPNSNLSIPIMMKQRKPPSWKTDKLKVWMIVMSSWPHLMRLKDYMDTHKPKMTGGDLKDLEKVGLGGEVHRAIRTVVVCDPASCQTLVQQKEFIPTRKFVLGNPSCIDVHPTETWILVGCEQRFACIWNYKTKERVMVWQQQVTSRKPGVFDLFKESSSSATHGAITSAKFIVQRHWCATGDDEGWVHVYAYPAAKDKVKELEAHHGKPVDSLAVHPTYPFLATSSSEDSLIKLWDWGQGWVCIRTFENEGWVSSLKWNPKDDNTVISASYYSIKVWDIHLPDPITTLNLKEGRNKACYLYTGSHKHHLMALADENCMDIWDLQRKERIHKLALQFYMYIDDIACHPTLPVLFLTTSTWGSGKDACIHLWDARTYRVEKIVRLTEVPQGKLFIIGTEDLTRLIAICKDGISIIEINLSGVRTD